MPDKSGNYKNLNEESKLNNLKSKQEGINNLKSFGELDKEQTQRESTLLSHLMGETGVEDLTRFEGELTERKSQILFEVATEIESTENALKQTEQLTQRLKKHLKQLKDLQRVLSK